MLEELQNPPNELCIAFFWVRMGHENEDVEKQRKEFKRVHDDLPMNSFYLVFKLDAKGYLTITLCTILESSSPPSNGGESKQLEGYRAAITLTY